MPTPRLSRTSPQRLLKNYILTKEVGKGLSETNLSLFTPIPGSVGQPNSDDAVSSELEIGFEFQFNGIIYNKFVVSTNGWILLVDPSYSFSLVDVLSSTSGENWSINSTFGGKQHLLLAPWFDDLKNKYDLASLFTSTQQDSVNKGLFPITQAYHPTMNGVMHCVEKNSSLGKRLVVRWHSISLAEDNVLVFECVIYENGRIEFRYSPRSNWRLYTGGSNDNATVGVFLDGYYQMRDFATELDYSKVARKLSLYGGAEYDASYSDTDTALNTANYSIALRPLLNWPGQKSFGSTLVFQPPLNKRRVLPRQTLRDLDCKNSLPTTARTGDNRQGNKNVIFNDNNSILYGKRKNTQSGIVIDGQQSVNYPTTLPRFYGNSTSDSTHRQDLFSGDFLVTGSVVKSLVQDFLISKDDSKVSAFEDHRRYESESREDSFFSAGTSPADVGFGFSYPLQSKTQIRMSFRVDHKTVMFGASSSIYYYNSATKRWQYPTSSFADGFDVANHYNDTYYNRLTEVDRGFNAFGFNISSGSNSDDLRINFSYATDDIFNKGWTRNNETLALNKNYSKSVQNDSRYEAIKDETFVIPISQPFLLEKAVVEIPFEMGPGWFKDKTQCFLPIGNLIDASYSPSALSIPFDVGGPGITFGLFNQVNMGGKTRRDLIMSGTITHSFDNETRILYSRSPDLVSLGGDVWQIIPQGFNAYGTPSAVITGVSGSTGYCFTGSIRMKCESAISNGVLVRDTIYMNQTSYLGYLTASLKATFNNPEWSLTGRGSIENFNQDPGGNGFRSRTIVAVNNLGRGGTGFEPSGRSILGKEYVTSQGLAQGSYSNVFYKYKDENILSELINIATTASPTPEFYATSAINQQKTLASPYLLFPNDRLVLSISKARPYFFSTEVANPYTTGSIQHDVKLSTGSINITLYGSLVSNGTEFHDTLNQELSSDAIHEVVIGETKTW